MSNKKVYIEYMRIIAIALVIFNHLPGYSLYGISGGVKQYFYMFLTMLTRINVPLFFMISGALLLKKQEDFKYIIKNRIPRYFIVILLFESGYYLIFNYKNLRTISIIEFGRELIQGNIMGLNSYWFLYSYIGLLFMLPFLQRVAKGFNRSEFWVLVGLHFIFSTFLPIANLYLTQRNVNPIVVSGHFSVPLATTKAFFYPLLGYYLDNKVEIEKIHVARLSVVAFLGINLSILCTYWEGKTGEYTQNYVQLFDYVTAIVSFILIKYFVTKVPLMSEGKMAEIICRLGPLTFGVYLLDPYLKLVGIWDKFETFAEPIMPTLAVSVFWVIISMCMGGIITYVLKKAPVLKKIL